MIVLWITPTPPPSLYTAHLTTTLTPPFHLLLLSASAQRTVRADFTHRFIYLSSAGVLPLTSPVFPPSPTPSTHPSVTLLSLSQMSSFPLPAATHPVLKERERKREREKTRDKHLAWWQPRISIEMEVCSHSQGSDEKLSSSRLWTVSRIEKHLCMHTSCIHAYVKCLKNLGMSRSNFQHNT